MSIPYDRSEYDTPGRGIGVLDVFRRRYLLKLLVQKGTSLRYRGTVLGWVWSFVRPTVQFIVYFVIVGHVLGQSQKVEDYPLYLFSGIVIVNVFNEGFTNATKSIVSNRSLVRKIYLPRELFPIAAVIGAFINFLPQLGILIFAAILFGWLPTFSSLGLILAALALIMSFSTGLGLMAAGINVRYRDAQNVVEIVRLVSTWSAPVLYTWVMIADALPTWAFALWASSPLTASVEMFHQGIWGPTVDVNIGFPPASESMCPLRPSSRSCSSHSASSSSAASSAPSPRICDVFTRSRLSQPGVRPAQHHRRPRVEDVPQAVFAVDEGCADPQGEAQARTRPRVQGAR